MDIQPIVAKSLSRAVAVFTKDLEALPESAFTQKFSDKARTVADIVHEVNLVNQDILKSIHGQPMSEWPEGWITAPAGFDSKRLVIDTFAEVAAEAVALAEASTEADMELPVESEFGPTNRAERFRFMTLHLWYHSGQLNYVQTLLGDDAWHW